WADTVEAARRIVDAGEIDLAPNHHHAGGGPMAGIISPAMTVWVVENATAGNRAYSNFNEGLGKVLRFGANDAAVIERLRAIARDVAPGPKAAVRRLRAGVRT